MYFIGFVYLEVLINKCLLFLEYSRLGILGNLWMEFLENVEFLGSDDMEVARSMYFFRERFIFRRFWVEFLEVLLNSEGFYII